MTASLYQSRPRSCVSFARAFFVFRHSDMSSTGDCACNIAVADKALANREQRLKSVGSAPTALSPGGKSALCCQICAILAEAVRPETAMSDDAPAAITVIREDERPIVDFVGGATYRPIVGDDTGEGLPIRTGIQ